MRMYIFSRENNYLKYHIENVVKERNIKQMFTSIGIISKSSEK